MVYSFWKIERYERTGDSVWSSTAEEITDCYDPVIRMSLGDGRDTFEFKLQNFNGEWNGQSIEGGSGFNIDDKIKVYYKINTSSVDSSDLLMQGIVTDIPYEVTGKQDFVRIKGNNYSETLMTALVFYTPPSAGQELYTFLAGAINSVALFNQDFKVTWSSLNPSTKRDGVTAFPSIYDKWFYKSALKLMEDYSTDSKTSDGNYYWYVNENNEVVWRPRTSQVDYSFNTSTAEYKALKVKKDTKGIVNFVIAKGGTDPNSNSITVKRDDMVSRAKHGFKYKLLTFDATTSNQMKDLDQQVVGTPSEPLSPSNYPSVSGWISEVTGSSVASGSWSDYIDNFREEVKSRLNSRAKSYIDEHKNGKLQVELEFTNGKGWGLGDVVSVTISEINAVNKPMRVKDVEYTMDSERFVLEEDEGTL